MRRSLPFLALCLVTACGRQSEPPPVPKAKARVPAVPAQPPVSEADRRSGKAAADALRHYYALIAAGDYASAYRLRTPGRVTEERFAANFAGYERYSVLVGAPSQPVEADGFAYVQIPVMITGRFKGGKPFGSSGNVMARRSASGGDHGWYILTED